MATLEKVLVKRKCNLQGAAGDFALVRKNVKISIVRAIDPTTGQLGAEEQVDTSLVTNERKYEAPKAPKEDKLYEADRPERKVCLLNDRGNTRYHLLRQGADYCKVLEVGTAGKGEWVLHSQIVDKFMVPSPTKAKYIPRQPIRVCQIEGREGNYLLLRQTTKGSRVIGPIVGDNYGETIENSLIIGEKKIVLKKSRKSGDTTETAVVVASNPPEADTPPAIPTPYSEVHGAHPAAQQAPAQPAPQQYQQPVQQAPVQQAPVQQRPPQAPQQPAQQAPQQHPHQAPQQGQRPDPRFQPGARPQQVPPRPAPVR